MQKSKSPLRTSTYTTSGRTVRVTANGLMPHEHSTSKSGSRRTKKTAQVNNSSLSMRVPTSSKSRETSLESKKKITANQQMQQHFKANPANKSISQINQSSVESFNDLNLGINLQKENFNPHQRRQSDIINVQSNNQGLPPL